MIVSFKFYMMDCVDFVLNYHTHITSHVTQVFASCTHYTSYSLLNIVHASVCVSFDLTNQVWNYFEFLCKTYFVFENFKGGYLKILNLGKQGLKLVFWKDISFHSYAFYSLYSMFCGVFLKIRLFFSKILFFHIFDWSNLFSINRNFF